MLRLLGVAALRPLQLLETRSFHTPLSNPVRSHKRNRRIKDFEKGQRNAWNHYLKFIYKPPPADFLRKVKKRRLNTARAKRLAQRGTRGPASLSAPVRRQIEQQAADELARQTPKLTNEHVFPGKSLVTTTWPFQNTFLNLDRQQNVMDRKAIRDLHVQVRSGEKNPDIPVIILRTGSGMAFDTAHHSYNFNGGMDLREIRELASLSPVGCVRALQQHFGFSAMLSMCATPVMAIYSGRTNIGLLDGARWRVATENGSFAVANGGYGFICDPGASFTLGQMPGHCGLYVGLTGFSLTPADAFYSGLISHVIATEAIPAMTHLTQGLVHKLTNYLETDLAQHFKTTVNKKYMHEAMKYADVQYNAGELWYGSDIAHANETSRGWAQLEIIRRQEYNRYWEQQIAPVLPNHPVAREYQKRPLPLEWRPNPDKAQTLENYEDDISRNREWHSAYRASQMITQVHPSDLLAYKRRVVREHLFSFIKDPKEEHVLDVGFLEQHQEPIDRIFGQDTLEQVVQSLRQEEHYSPFAQQTLRAFAKTPPLLLKASFKLYKLAMKMDRFNCMKLEFRLMQRFLNSPDFHAAVKMFPNGDGVTPKWQIPSLDQVTDEMIDDMFAPRTDDYLLDLRPEPLFNVPDRPYLMDADFPLFGGFNFTSTPFMHTTGARYAERLSSDLV